MSGKSLRPLHVTPKVSACRFLSASAAAAAPCRPRSAPLAAVLMYSICRLLHQINQARPEPLVCQAGLLLLLLPLFSLSPSEEEEGSVVRGGGGAAVRNQTTGGDEAAAALE